jgi:uncharacterized LabA/DUF88 family protein
MAVSREIAIMIDGGFLTKRLAKLVKEPDKLSPTAVCGIIRSTCRKHVQKLTGDEGSNWHRHVYRIFYYDAPPFEGQAHHPLTGQQVNFKKSDQAAFQTNLFAQLRKQRNMALRLGNLSNLGGWTVEHGRLAKLLRIKPALDNLHTLPRGEDGSLTISADEAENLLSQAEHWRKLEDWMVKLDLRQKGVDMRIGLDIASLTLKRLASTIILIAGDADFVPAAKLARREGVQFILDPLWQKVNEDLFEHIDGLQTVLAKPGEVVNRGKVDAPEN